MESGERLADGRAACRRLSAAARQQSGNSLSCLSTASDQAGAYAYYIRYAVPGCQPVLIQALESLGYSGMAGDFEMCGQKELAKAGKDWLWHHMYTRMGVGSPRVRWGYH